MEGLLSQPQEHGRILADRIEQDRPLALGDHLAQNMDAFCLQLPKMAEGTHLTAGYHNLRNVDGQIVLRS
jgi:hypothetical protein